MSSASNSMAVESVLTDDRPIALRRKRRASTNLSSPQKPASTGNASSSLKTSQFAGTRTPTKPKKRVRFSDPGPETLSPTSTGITPFVARTRLSPNLDDSTAPPSPPLRLLARPPRRCASLPNISAPLQDSAAVVGSASRPIDVEIQFAPLRQLLSERAQRRLRRNGLSEELSNIEAEKRNGGKWQQEVRKLREELELARAGSATTVSDDCAGNNREKVRELELEISALKQEVGERETEAELNIVEAGSADADSDSVELIGTESGYGSASSRTSVVDEDQQYHDEARECTPCTPTTPARFYVSTATSTSLSSCSSVTTQTTLSSAALEVLHTHLQTQANDLSHARLALERLFPGETPLPLSASPSRSTFSPTGTLVPAFPNPTPLLAALLTHLQTLKSSLAAANSSLLSARDNHSALLTQFNASLHTISTLRSTNSSLSEEHSLSERSRAALSAALERYRAEAADLERLVGELERTQALSAAAAEQRQSDLQAEVAAETRGRREAETQIDTLQGILRQEREEREREVGALNSRLGASAVEVSGLVAELAEMRRCLGNAVEECARLVAAVEVERKEGRRVVEGLRGWVGDVGLRVGEWEAGLAERENNSTGDAMAIRTSPSKSTATASNPNSGGGWGLLTPTVEGGRFRDSLQEHHLQKAGSGSESCEGRVTIERGRGQQKGRRSRKVDSGIGILMEDVEDEDGGED